MKKMCLSCFALIFTLLCFVSCDMEQNVSKTGIVKIALIDLKDSKTVSPEGDVNISHYVIDLYNKAKDLHISSGLLEKNKNYLIANVDPGFWSVSVHAYVINEEQQILIASGSSSEKEVVLGETTEYVVSLELLKQELSGNINLDLLFPSSFEGESIDCIWTIKGSNAYLAETWSSELKGLKVQNNKCSVTINAADPDGSKKGLYAGTYTLEVTASTASGDKRTGFEVMRLLPILDSYGEINLSFEQVDSNNVHVNVIDKLGKEIAISTIDGKYTLTENQGIIELVGISEKHSVLWYLDGVLQEDKFTEQQTGKYSFKDIPYGEHVLIAVVTDNTELLSLGTIQIKFDIKHKIGDVVLTEVE